jgi:hypothetical protein
MDLGNVLEMDRTDSVSQILVELQSECDLGAKASSAHEGFCANCAVTKPLELFMKYRGGETEQEYHTHPPTGRFEYFDGHGPLWDSFSPMDVQVSCRGILGI